MRKIHRVELVNRDRITLDIPEDQPILDAIEAAGLCLPVGCRYGVCITCAARLISGEVEQSQAIALKPEQAAMGYVLLCVAYPRSDCQFDVGIESQWALYANPFKSKPTSRFDYPTA